MCQFKDDRPFSCAQLWENSQKSVPRAAIQATLTQMVAEGKLLSKSFGKTVCYFKPQEAADIVPLFEELPRVDHETHRTQNEAARIEARARTLAAQPTNADLEAEPPRADLDARLVVLKSQNFVTPRELAKAKHAYNHELRRWRELRRAVSAAVDAVRERCDVDAQHLSGVFDDREAGVTGPPPTYIG
ncbi:hypothetical protein CTAYLR_007531 [Chrysophaeum taylorii]|uniref:Homologous-pairing protein 2 winged helix domain-containing protein n=1 Tax=Chrysophaeum taylorii TaxID=2483200 RepID=A0AAD7U7G7_9STRA|nr:hypothetical protein CTAYLR_007531 [Chrysophaeum taylorii]